MIDGGLRPMFRKKIAAQWTSIESPLTVGGIPDAEVCFSDGRSCWLEFKKTNGWTVHIRPLQVSWHEHRARLGGRSFIAVRRMSRADDDLYLFHGSDVRRLKDEGLRSFNPAGHWSGGPGNWDWAEVESLLSG